MRPLSLILFCNQPDLKGNPLESWVFDDLGGSNYLDIVLNRLKKIENINKIYLLTDSSQMAVKLANYGDQIVTVKVMSHNSYRPLGLNKGSIYNLYSRDEECIASWIYDVMKSNNEEMVFVDSVLRGFVNFLELNKLRERLIREPGHCYSMVGELGYEGLLLDITFAENCIANPKYDGLIFDHPENLKYGHLYNYVNYTTNRSLKTYTDFSWNLVSKKRWQFFKDFYAQVTVSEEIDIYAQFIEYFRIYKFQLSKTDIIQVEIECVDHLGDLKDSVVEKLIFHSLPFGRLTFVLRNLDKHPTGDAIVEKLHSAGLHIYSSIKGHRSPDFYEKIYKYSNVINFELRAHTPEFHSKRFPEDNAQLIFHNYFNALMISQKFQSLAVGVSYEMPDDAAEAIQAIIFFRERQAVNPFFDSSDSRPGLKTPHIQFLRVINTLDREEMAKFGSAQTLRMNSQGQYDKDISCFQVDFEKYVKDYGFDSRET